MTSLTPNDLNCKILNSCINAQNIDPSQGDRLINDIFYDKWPSVVNAYQTGGCPEALKVMGLPEAQCANGQGIFFAGCPEGVNYVNRNTRTPVASCIMPGNKCPYTPACPSSTEGYAKPPVLSRNRPGAYVNVNQAWASQKPFQL